MKKPVTQAEIITTLELMEDRCIDSLSEQDLDTMCEQAGITVERYKSVLALAMGTLNDMVHYLELNGEE